MPSPFSDPVAASRLAELCEDNGLSPEALAAGIKLAAKTAPWGERGTVDAHTLRRIVGPEAHKPTTRVRFVIANYFGLRPDELWHPRNARSNARAVAA